MKIDTVTRRHNGRLITLDWHTDDTQSAPWKEYDDHGIVSEWTSRKKAPGERILATDRGSHLLYDFAGTIKKAMAEGWDAKPYGGTPGEKAARAVEADYEFLRRYCRDDWYYVGYIVTIEGMEFASDEKSLWGICSDDMQENADEAFQAAVAWIDAELAESFDAACRDIATVNP